MLYNFIFNLQQTNLMNTESITLPAKSLITILLVEDDETTRQMIRSVLQNQLDNVNIIEASNGEEALQQIDLLDEFCGVLNIDEGRHFDFLLLDLHMPKMDGVEFLRQLAQRRCRADQVVLISASDQNVLDATKLFAELQDFQVYKTLQKTQLPRALKALAIELSKHQHNHTLPADEAQRSRFPCTNFFNREMIQDGLDNHQIELFYQPKISVPQPDAIYLESLARWRHPQYGIVDPIDFIGVAEQSGLSDQLTQAVIDRALKDMLHWQQQGIQTHIAINLSYLNLYDVHLPERLANKVLALGLKPQYLTLEITESTKEKNLVSLLDILIRLRLKGFTLSIDDFGTGTSSMSKLDQLPFSQLKIDRLFVHNAPNDLKKMAMVTHTIAMAKELGLEVVVEGIETEQERAFFIEHGVDFMQGFLFSRPLEADQVLPWYKAFNPSR